MSDDILVRAAELQKKYEHLRQQLTLLVDSSDLDEEIGRAHV